MSSIDKIKKGILDNDMEQVIKGFKSLTGQEVRPKETTVGGLELLEEETIAEEVVKLSTSSKDLDFSTEPKKQNTNKQRTARREPIAVGENQFVDDGIEAKDVTTPDVSLTPRKRPPSKTVEVTCHVCEKTSEIPVQLSQGEFHRCNDCIGTK